MNMKNDRRKFILQTAGTGLFLCLSPVQRIFGMNTNYPGIISKQSKYTVKESMDRLQKILLTKGVTIFARIDQQAEAKKTGLDLLPMELMIFGNPATGTPIMSAVPIAGLDLPLKVLAWQDKENIVWLSYNDPVYFQQRYALPDALVTNIDFAPLIQQVVS